MPTDKQPDASPSKDAAPGETKEEQKVEESKQDAPTEKKEE